VKMFDADETKMIGLSDVMELIKLRIRQMRI